MSYRAFRLLPLCVVLFVTSCNESETPTGPIQPASGTVHVLGINGSAAGTVGLENYVAAGYPISLNPGESVEMYRYRAQTTGARALVYKTIAEVPHFAPAVWVVFNVLKVPAAQADEISGTLRISVDAAGVVTAKSDSPDVLQVTSIEPAAI